MYVRDGHYSDNGFIRIHQYGDCEEHNYKEQGRQNCLPEGGLCWEKGPYPGPRFVCYIGRHRPELNIYRHKIHHYHCLFCGKGMDF